MNKERIAWITLCLLMAAVVGALLGSYERTRLKTEKGSYRVVSGLLICYDYIPRQGSDVPGGAKESGAYESALNDYAKEGWQFAGTITPEGQPPCLVLKR